MRRDTQIGIILGIVILVIIGVFLSTRTSDRGMVLPDLILSEGVRQKAAIKEIDINGFFKESKKAEPEDASPAEYFADEALASEDPEKPEQITHFETPDDSTSLEGKWEGVAEEIVEEEVEESEIAVLSEIIEDTEVAQKIPSVQKTVIQQVVEEKEKEESLTSSYGDPVYYKVQANDNLFKIAKRYYGDGKKWVEIYEANSDSMPDSNSIYVGQKLLIPDITVEKKTYEVVQKRDRGKYDTAETHTVEAGDTLYRLADKYYDDPGVWIKILEANKDIIEDEGLLKEGMVLFLPNL